MSASDPTIVGSLAILLLTACSCSTAPTSGENEVQPVEKARDTTEPPRSVPIAGEAGCEVWEFDAVWLEQVYEKHDSAALAKLFEEWHKCTAGERVLTGEAVPDWVFDAYEIFIDFYNPYDLSRFGDSRTMNDEAPYFIVQDVLRIGFCASLVPPEQATPGESCVSRGTVVKLEEFLPKVEFEGKKALYLEAYSNELDVFLDACGIASTIKGDEVDEAGFATSHRDAMQRIEFLRRYVPVDAAHWRGWYVVTHPRVQLIDFDSDFDEAIVYFRIGHGGAQARYKKQDGAWRMGEISGRWIE